MKVKMSKSGFNHRGKLAADRKQREAESIRKARSAKICKELGVTGPDDPTLPLKIDLAQLRKDVGTLRTEFTAFQKSVQLGQVAKTQEIGSRPTPRNLQRPATRSLRSR